MKKKKSKEPKKFIVEKVDLNHAGPVLKFTPYSKEKQLGKKTKKLKVVK